MGEPLRLSRAGPRPGIPAWAERRLSWLFWACAVALAPWVVFLFITQVSRAEAHQVRPLSTGLLLGMIAGILVTAWTYYRGSPLAVLTASFTAAAAFIAAWFRCLTLAGGSHWIGSIPTLLVLIVVIIGLCVVVVRSEFAARVPARWLPLALIAGALALVPPIVVRLTVTPAPQTAHHLKLAWTGLDVFEVVALSLTALALQRRPSVTAIPAAVTGALLICDAWINIVPARGAAFWEAIAMAFVELPLAALSFWVATRHPARPPGWLSPGPGGRLPVLGPQRPLEDLPGGHPPDELPASAPVRVMIDPHLIRSVSDNGISFHERQVDRGHCRSSPYRVRSAPGRLPADRRRHPHG